MCSPYSTYAGLSLCLTCHLAVVLLQLMDLGPLGSILLVNVHLVVVGAQGDL